MFAENERQKKIQRDEEAKQRDEDARAQEEYTRMLDKQE